MQHSREDFLVGDIHARKEAALNSTRDKLIESMLHQKLADSALPPGSSIVTKLTGDSAQILHQAREKERQMMRSKVVLAFHTASHSKENQTPLAQSTSLNVGRDDSLQR